MNDLELIVALLSRPAAYEISVTGLVEVFRMEDGRYVVYDHRGPYTPKRKSIEHIVATAREAAELFLKIRHERKLGFDYEEGTANAGPDHNHHSH